MTESGKIKERWKQNSDKLFNALNPREQLDELRTTEGPVECFSLDEVKKILRTNKMPNDWRKSRMVPIFKGKCDVGEVGACPHS